jgi:O6-methylguanine-DNA--protein-cysteine methyltransferase
MRATGTSGDLIGFGGGLDTRKAMLRLEAEDSGRPL